MTGRRTIARGAGVLLLTALPAWSGAAAAHEDPDDDAALRAAVAAEVLRPRAPILDRSLFLARSGLRDVALAPDGSQVAWLRHQGPNRSVWLLPTAGGAPRQVVAQTEAEHLSWTRDSRWILLETPRQVFALAAAGGAGSGAIAALGGAARRELAAVDPVLPAAILVLERPPVVSRAPRRWRLYRVDMRGRQNLIHEDDKEIVDFAFDPGGRLAFLLRAEGEEHVLYRVRAAGDLREAARCVRLERCSLLATVATIGASGRSGDIQPGRDLLLLAHAGGTFLRLVRLEADDSLRTLHVDPRAEADVRAVELDPVTQEPLIASYATTLTENYGLTPDAKRHVAAIQRQFPQRAFRIEVGSGPAARWLVHERAGSLRGERLHLYDPRTGDLREVAADVPFESAGRPLPRPAESAMARKIAFSWRASDGMRLHGFLMVPPGIHPSRAPLVALVHGGPFNLVRPEFSNDGQLLANRGYIAFQPNFRGSTGHGREYMFAAQGDFGNGRVQQDIVDGVRHLLGQGIGDPARVGIAGASFGGYSALLGVTFEPELFKVGIAAVPPADFGWVLREYLGAGTEMVAGVPFATSMRHLGLDPADEKISRRLREQSPVANAERLRRPLLMLAGGEDERVPIRGVTHYAARLRTLGKEFSLFVDADAGHAVDDARTREAYYYLLEALLHLHLGGPAPRPPDRDLRAHLRRNLRLTSRDLETLLSADVR
jgi:dipeptidyl aminopeptidase/acylaminoacyl peptidase